MMVPRLSPELCDSHSRASGNSRALVSLCLVLVWLTALCTVASAGIRGPGKYSGVVIFDRWDGCILFSGVYLMYISESVKEGLRAYAGQAIEIEAFNVFQPINPGDGLIRSYMLLGPAPETSRWAVTDGLTLSAERAFSDRDLPSVTLTVSNHGKDAVTVRSSQIGLALMAKKEWRTFFDPADGPSTAVITRTSVLRSEGRSALTIDGVRRSWSYTVDATNAVPEFFDLEPGQSRSTTITFQVSPGEYEFFFGYGGGVHEEKCIVSNRVSFDVDR